MSGWIWEKTWDEKYVQPDDYEPIEGITEESLKDENSKDDSTK